MHRNSQDAHTEAILDKAFTEAKKCITDKHTKSTYIYISQVSTGWGWFQCTEEHIWQSRFIHDVGNVINKATDLLQSDCNVQLNGFKASFNFITNLDGGAPSVCRDKLSILNKPSGNRGTHDDNNRFSYALSMLMYGSHKSMGGISK